MELTVTGPVWFWRGPAPWHFVTVGDEESDLLAAASSTLSYGWGMIPVTARIGASEWTTSLFLKDGRYIVPVRTSVRRAEVIEAGDMVTIKLAIGDASCA